MDGLMDKLALDYFRRGLHPSRVVATAANDESDVVFMIVENRWGEGTLRAAQHSMGPAWSVTKETLTLSQPLCCCFQPSPAAL